VGRVFPTKTNNAFSGGKWMCFRIIYKNCPTERCDGAKNLCLGRSGISAAFAERVTKIGIFPGYFSLNFKASPYVRNNLSPSI
jgi:hypothetical protein